MDNLNQIVSEEVEKYGSGGRGMRLFPLLDHLHQVYAVNAVEHPKRTKFAGVIVMARIAGDKVVIEYETTDKPLLDALLQRGIPREQIVLAYQGEPIPDPERFDLFRIRTHEL
jgi:hypothetical protein